MMADKHDEDEDEEHEHGRREHEGRMGHEGMRLQQHLDRLTQQLKLTDEQRAKVRTILYQTGSGKNVCGFGMHSHPAHLYIQLNAAKFRVTTPDGKTTIEEGKAGEVGWEPAVTHRVESVSGESVTTYLVEVKDKDWKPSTNLSL